MDRHAYLDTADRIVNVASMCVDWFMYVRACVVPVEKRNRRNEAGFRYPIVGSSLLYRDADWCVVSSSCPIRTLPVQEPYLGTVQGGFRMAKCVLG